MAAAACRFEQAAASRCRALWISGYPATERRGFRPALALERLEDRAARIPFLHPDCYFAGPGDRLFALARTAQPYLAVARNLDLHIFADRSTGRDILSRVDAESSRTPRWPHRFAGDYSHSLRTITFQ